MEYQATCLIDSSQGSTVVYENSKSIDGNSTCLGKEETPI